MSQGILAENSSGKHASGSLESQQTRGAPPKTLELTLRLKNWAVVEAEPSSAAKNTLGSFQYVERLLKNQKVFIKFQAERFPDHYWLAPLPDQPDGEFPSKAILYSEPCQICVSAGDPHTPPASVQLVVDLENGYIQKHYVMNPLPWWGHFEFSYLDQENHALYLRNPAYPGFEWKAEYPQKNGKWSISLELIRE